MQGCVNPLYSQVFQTSQLLEDRPTLQSARLPDLPIATARATAIVIARNVYVCGGGCHRVDLACSVQRYDLDNRTWTKLPPAPQYWSETVAINNQPALVGGRDASSHAITNIVSMWTGQDWKQDLPPMPTKRYRPGVTTYDTYVIVAGGVAEDQHTLLSSINVLDTITRQWWTPDNLQLPRPMCHIQIMVNATNICVASANVEYDVSTETVESSKRVWQLPESRLENVLTNGDHSPHQWTEVVPTPNHRSAFIQHTAYPLAVGGCQDSYKPTPNIVMHDPVTNRWSTVGQLLEPRAECTVVALSSNSFLVCGGFSDPRDTQTRLHSVEVLHCTRVMDA